MCVIFSLEAHGTYKKNIDGRDIVWGINVSFLYHSWQAKPDSQLKCPKIVLDHMCMYM